MFKSLTLLLGLSQQLGLDGYFGVVDGGALGGPDTTNIYITKADIKNAGLTLSADNPYSNGRIESANIDDCRKICAVQKGCLYYMWSDASPKIASTHRCYTYGDDWNFGSGGKYKKPYGDMGYHTWANCKGLFEKWVPKVLIS